MRRGLALASHVQTTHRRSMQRSARDSTVAAFRARPSATRTLLRATRREWQSASISKAVVGAGREN
jgi:hypothetical protein